MKVDIERLQDLKDKLTQMERQMGELLANLTRDVNRTAANTSSNYHDHHGVTSCCDSVLDTAKRINRLNDKLSDMLKRSEKGLDRALDTYVSIEKKQTTEIDQFIAWIDELYTSLVNSDAANDLNKWLDNASNAAERIWDNLWTSVTVSDETSTGWGTTNNGLGSVSAAQVSQASSTAIQGAKIPDNYYNCVACHADVTNKDGSNDFMSKSFRSAFEGSADAVIGKTVIDKVSDIKLGKTRIPALGPAFEVRTASVRTGVRAVKGFSKAAGPVAVVSYGYDVYQDIEKYDGYDAAKAVTITTAGTCIAAGAGMIATGFGAPVGVAVIVGAGVAVAASYLGDWLKESWIGH